MKASVRFANDIIDDISEKETKSTDSTPEKTETTLKQIAFEIESGLTRLDVSVKGLEILLEIDEHANLIVANNRRHERVASIQLNRSKMEDIDINQSYLNWLQSEMHLTQYRIITVTNIHTKNKQSTNSPTIISQPQLSQSHRNSEIFDSTFEAVEAQLNEINKEYSSLESMFNMLWKAWVKQYTKQQRDMMKRQQTNFKNDQISSTFNDDDNDTKNNNNNNKNSKNTNSNNNNNNNNSKNKSKLTKQGYMTKLGKVRKNWKRRLFILTEDGMLRYYNVSGGNNNNSNSNNNNNNNNNHNTDSKLKKKLLNEIDLSFATRISIISSNDNKYGKPYLYVFCLPALFSLVF